MDIWVVSTFWLPWIILPEHLSTSFCVDKCFHFFFIFFFLGPYLWHMEVLRLGVESKPQPLQCQIRAVSSTYTTSCSNAGSLTHWVRPGIEPTSSWILVRFVSAVTQWELQPPYFKLRSYPEVMWIKMSAYFVWGEAMQHRLKNLHSDGLFQRDRSQQKELPMSKDRTIWATK